MIPDDGTGDGYGSDDEYSGLGSSGGFGSSNGNGYGSGCGSDYGDGYGGGNNSDYGDGYGGYGNGGSWQDPRAGTCPPFPEDVEDYSLLPPGRTEHAPVARFGPGLLQLPRVELPLTVPAAVLLTE